MSETSHDTACSGVMDCERRVARLLDTKNGSARDVPLSSAAVAAIQTLPPVLRGPVFGIASRSATVMVSRTSKRADIFNVLELLSAAINPYPCSSASRTSRRRSWVERKPMSLLSKYFCKSVSLPNLKT